MPLEGFPRHEPRTGSRNDELDCVHNRTPSGLGGVFSCLFCLSACLFARDRVRARRSPNLPKPAITHTQHELTQHWPDTALKP